MAIDCQYPLFLIKHGGGYVSVVDPSAPETAPVQALSVFSDEALAGQFIDAIGIMAGIKEIRNARDFAWLLTSLQAPVSEVVMDPEPNSPEIKGLWRRTVAQMLAEHLEFDYSPWNYPVFAILERNEAQQQGWSCIDGTKADGSQVKVAALFTSQELADAYLRDADQEGDIYPLPNVAAVRTWLTEIQAEVAAVAIAPIVQDGIRQAQQCISVDRLLHDYLISRKP